jgi:hypothetical protein
MRVGPCPAPAACLRVRTRWWLIALGAEWRRRVMAARGMVFEQLDGISVGEPG